MLMRFMELMPADSEFVTGITKKLSPPLVTLLSSEPEVGGKERELCDIGIWAVFEAGPSVSPHVIQYSVQIMVSNLGYDIL